MEQEDPKTQDPVAATPVSTPTETPSVPVAAAPPQVTPAEPSTVVTQETQIAQPLPPTEKPKGGSLVMRIAIVFLAVALLAVIGYVAYTVFLVPQSTPTQTIAPLPLVTEAPTPVATSSATPFATTTPVASASPTIKASPTASPSGSY